MKKLYRTVSITSVFFALISLSGCLKDKLTLPNQNEQDYNLVYMSQAVSSPKISTLLFKDEDQFLVYGASYGGVGYPKTDIPVSFVVSTDSVAAFNLRNKTNYPILPAESFKLNTLNAVIPKGQLGTEPLKITVKTVGALDLFKEYLLPVTVKMAQGQENVKLNNGLSTTYFIVKASLNLSDFSNFDRSNWKILSFSSEETNGEGPNNGKAIYAIDNNINSYWHSRYSDTFADPPHILIIDMNEIKTLHGVSFVARQNENRGRPMQVTVQYGLNGTDWTTSEDFDLQSTNDTQRMFFLSGFKDARYLKLIIKKMYDGATHTHLAEFAAF